MSMTTIQSDLAESTTTDMISSRSVNRTDEENIGSKKSGAEIYLFSYMIFIGTIGMIGNFTVFVVIQRITTQKIKFLIRSQAMIDFLTSLVLVADTFFNLFPVPIPKDNYVIRSLYFLWNSDHIMFGLFSVSTWNLVVISIERYIAVVYPMWYRFTFSKRKAVLLGFAAWTIAPTMQITYLIVSRFLRFASGKCALGVSAMSLKTRQIIGVSLFLWDFFIPCMIMGFCFTRASLKQDRESKIIRAYVNKNTVSRKVYNDHINDKYDGKIRKDTIKGDDVRKNTAAEMSRSRNVTQTFVIIFVVYVICWITNQCLFLQYNLGGYPHWSKAENYFANSMAILNSACNPFIYVLHLKVYREKVRAFLSSWKCK